MQQAIGRPRPRRGDARVDGHGRLQSAVRSGKNSAGIGAVRRCPIANVLRGNAWLIVLAVLCANAAEAAKLTSTERTQIQEPRPADIPSDEVLEAQGAIIGKIELDVRQIFDEHDPRENSGLYHLADQLHAFDGMVQRVVCPVGDYPIAWTQLDELWEGVQSSNKCMECTDEVDRRLVNDEL